MPYTAPSNSNTPGAEEVVVYFVNGIHCRSMKLKSVLFIWLIIAFWAVAHKPKRTSIERPSCSETWPLIIGEDIQ